MPSGSCLCGNITFEYTGEPQATALCHCADCQKISGGGSTSTVVIPSDAFKVTKGTPKSYVGVALSGKTHTRLFCGDCGAGVYSFMEAMPGATLVRAGALDNGAADTPIAIEFFTKDRRSFVTPVQGAQQLQTMA